MMSDSEKMTQHVLEGIANGVKNYFHGKISKDSIFNNDQFVSFSFYVEEVQDVASCSLYRSQMKFHGNLTNGGYYSGSFNEAIIFIHSDDSGISASISY